MKQHARTTPFHSLFVVAVVAAAFLGASGCSDGSSPPPDDQDGGCSADVGCQQATCGDGTVAGGEQCDDGNAVDGDGCDNDCTFSCESTADCDDGNACNGQEVCNTSVHQCVEGTPAANGTPCGGGTCRDGACAPPGCGDGSVDNGEQCDDGNTTEGDGCDNDCTYSCESDDDCNDGNSCNGVEACDTAAHECTYTTCDDGDPCTDDVCHTDGPCTFELIDVDGDGYAPALCTTPGLMGGDCDDGNDRVNPGETERCDPAPSGADYDIPLDNDCNGMEDEGITEVYLIDRDGDGYGDPAVKAPCKYQGYVPGPSAPNGKEVDCYDDASSDKEGRYVYSAQTRYFDKPFCKDGTATSDGAGGWTCTGGSGAGTPSWDYDCDGSVSKQYEETLGYLMMCGCDFSSPSGCQCLHSEGWQSITVPDCGVEEQYSYCGATSSTMCTAVYETTWTQGCR